MAADTAAKRYSAMHISSPWRGLNVVPDVTIPAGERAAAMFLYSGISGAPPVIPDITDPSGIRVGGSMTGPGAILVGGFSGMG